MPAEWEPHVGTWLTWPRREGISFPDIYDRIPPIFATMIRALSRGEGVFINVCDSVMEKEAREILKQYNTLNNNVNFFHHPSDEPWCRDHGPIFVKNETTRAIINWDYNAWGKKYSPCDNDNEIPKRIASACGLECHTPGMVLEGGSIEVNGQGTLLTTEQCLLHPNRNPELDQEDLERLLREFLNVHTIIWLGDGLMDDETDGHVDNLACFIRPGAVLALVSSDPEDENYEVLKDNLGRLKHAKDARGRSLEIVTIEQPEARWKDEERLAQSYINFYLPNGGVVFPSFDDPVNDEAALRTLEKVFPERRIVQLDVQEIVNGGGGIHCITQQQPEPLESG